MVASGYIGGDVDDLAFQDVLLSAWSVKSPLSNLESGELVVVLVGETSKELLGRLKEQYKSELDEDEDAMRIVTVKPISAA